MHTESAEELGISGKAQRVSFTKMVRKCLNVHVCIYMCVYMHVLECVSYIPLKNCACKAHLNANDSRRRRVNYLILCAFASECVCVTLFMCTYKCVCLRLR